MINIRKLAAVDMVGLGTRVIVTEYAFGIVLPFILGVLSIRAGFTDATLLNWQTLLGVWLVGIALNYIPLFIYAVVLARSDKVKQEGQPELAHAKRYGVQQVVILVPLLVVVLALMQETTQRK
jgi:hypothetical protein